MAVTISRYNGTTKYIVDTQFSSITFKAMLLNASASFVATNTTLNQVSNSGANQVSGNGWPAGGVTLAGVTATIVDTNGVMIDATDIDVDATGGPIGPASALVIYDDADANKIPLWYVDFGGAQSAGDGTPFKITFSANGISRITSA
jgi:hypothetical protein